MQQLATISVTLYITHAPSQNPTHILIRVYKMAGKKIVDVTASYTRLKKFLNKYHKFSFSAPRKGKLYAPQQKAAITRIYNKIEPQIKAEVKNKITFLDTSKIPKKLIPANDGIKTNKGFFFKYPAASIQKFKKGKKFFYEIVIDYSKIGNSPFKEIYFKFPDYVKTSLDDILEFIEYLKSVWNPYYTKLSAQGRLYATQINLKEFFTGSGRAVLNDDDDDAGDDVDDNTRNETNFFSGVILGFDTREQALRPKLS